MIEEKYSDKMEEETGSGDGRREEDLENRMADLEDILEELKET